MPSETFLLGAALVAILVFALALHEAAHALVAHWCGDDTAKDLGRITLNPIKSIDPFLTIILPALLFFVLPRVLGTPPLIFGGAKPVPVVPSNLRHPYRDMMWVALAGPATNFVLAAASMVLLKGLLVADVVEPDDLGAKILRGSVQFNVLLTVFNMIPIPPLDGSRVMTYALPGPLRSVYLALTPLGVPLLIALLFFVPGGQDVLFDWMGRVYDWMAGAVEGLFALFGSG
ncbi:MAG: site-2 protease family protein [Planctomycetota bacterium]